MSTEKLSDQVIELNLPAVFWRGGLTVSGRFWGCPDLPKWELEIEGEVARCKDSELPDRFVVQIDAWKGVLPEKVKMVGSGRSNVPGDEIAAVAASLLEEMDQLLRDPNCWDKEKP